jgi:DNA-binding CsgD family transcriptional regulator
MIETPELRTIIDEFPFPAGYKNQDSVFTGSNNEFAKIVGLKQGSDVVGRTAFDMPAKTAECAELFHEQDQMVLNTGKQLVIFGIHPDDEGNFKAYKFIKMPLQNMHNEITGILFTGEEICNKTMYELSVLINNLPIKTNGKSLLQSGSYLVGTEHTEINLCERKHEVLFYMLHGKKANFIANVLRISLSTVYRYIAELKTEFNVLSSFELKDKALEMGFFNVLPYSVFNKEIAIALNQN